MNFRMKFKDTTHIFTLKVINILKYHLVLKLNVFLCTIEIITRKTWKNRRFTNMFS